MSLAAEVGIPRELRRRVLTALLYGGLVLAALYFGLFLFLPLVAIGAVLAYYELWRLFAARPFAPSLPGGLVLVVAFLALHSLGAFVRASTLTTQPPSGAVITVAQPGNVIALALLVAGGTVVFRRDVANGLAAALLTVGGALYCGWLLGYLVDLGVTGIAIAGPLDSELLARSLVALAVFPTWASDVGAWAIGHLIGRHKLAPQISPGKTVEGALGGLVAAV